MMNAAQLKEKAKAQFLARATDSIEVPQWGATIYFKTPNLTTIKSAMADAKGDNIEAQARIVVACATDENGDRIWSKAEYKDLMIEYDPGAVAMIAGAIMKNVSLAPDAAHMADDEKN
jgi:hypothetical protein